MRLGRDKTRGCVKSVEGKFGNDQIFDMGSFDESSRWIGWSRNVFSHCLALQRFGIAGERWRRICQRQRFGLWANRVCGRRRVHCNGVGRFSFMSHWFLASQARHDRVSLSHDLHFANRGQHHRLPPSLRSYGGTGRRTGAASAGR